MTADLRALPLHEQVRARRLSRHERAFELRGLAEQVTLDVPPSTAVVALCLAAWAHRSLPEDRAAWLWQDYVAEYRAWSDQKRGVELKSLGWDDETFGDPEKDAEAALTRLLDGNDNGGIAG